MVVKVLLMLQITELAVAAVPVLLDKMELVLKVEMEVTVLQLQFQEVQQLMLVEVVELL